MRIFEITAAVGSLVALAIAAPASHYVVHEKRSHMPDGWVKRQNADKDVLLPVRIGLKQTNMHLAHDKLMALSDPQSSSYGQHMSQEEIMDFFAPTDDTVAAVREWLSTSGISNVRQSFNKGWLEFKASVSEVEELLKTKYDAYEHDSGKPHLACEEYSVPAHIQEHVELIMPTLHFDVAVAHPEDPKFKRSALDVALEKRGPVGSPKIGSGPIGGPKGVKIVKGQKIGIAQVMQCSNYITSGCLRTLYQIPKNGVGLNLSSFGIVEYAPQTFLQSDLNKFESNIAETNYDLTTNTGGEPVGTGPIIEGIDGGYFYTAEQDPNLPFESDLDLEYAIDLTYPQSVTLYQVGDNAGVASFNNFLDGIDGSYCTSGGGDDYNYDQKFPDNGTGGYKGQRQCGVWTPAKVISTSYGYNEHDLTPAYEQRQCAEYMKLGMNGVSVLYSSGDYGVAGNRNQCIAADGSYNTGLSGRFNPGFPAGCPYVTSVGATQIPAINGSATKPEVACETVIYSGGGFSNVFPQPSYQKAALRNYYKNYKPTYSSSQYNNSQAVRAFPDVSANGANYLVYADGEGYLLYGTSASSPVFASIITLINNVRAQAGKPSLGFLNTAFYQSPGMFHDIKSGHNPGCGTQGFAAVPGWDPVTGLGTPNYNKLLAKLSA